MPLSRSAWLELDLAALARNLDAIRGHVGPGVRVEPVVKADAYGHGAVPVALALQALGVDGLSVAAFDEAVELRDAGIRVPILVLFPATADVVGEASVRGITLGAGDVELLQRTLSAAARRAEQVPLLQLHLEIETGLGRGGVDTDGVEAAARAIAAVPGVKMAGTWTHLAAPRDTERTRRQIARFGEALARLAAAGIPPGIRHLAATGGLIAGAPAYDAVRPGLSIYGLLPDGIGELGGLPDFVTGLRPVMSLRARPIRVAHLEPGEGVSYGPSFETSRPSRIATLPIGYADGWARALSNRADALVRGVRAPVVGTVAMDAIMVDVTDVPGAPVTIDDEFVLLGSDGQAHIAVAEVARARNTISWEVLTSMARRLPRVYHAAAGIMGVRTLTNLERHWLDQRPGTPGHAVSRLSGS